MPGLVDQVFVSGGKAFRILDNTCHPMRLDSWCDAAEKAKLFATVERGVGVC